MQSRRTLTLTLSLLQRERGTFGGTVSGSPNRDPRQVRTSSPRSERGEDQGEGCFGLHTYGLAGGAGAAEGELLSGDVAEVGLAWGAGAGEVEPASDGADSVGADSDGVAGVKAGSGAGGATSSLVAGCAPKMSR